MNGLIFKIFGIGILIFELLLVLVFSLAISRVTVSRGENIQASILFFGFLLISTLVAVGLFRLQRWAAVTASALGLAWSLIIASAVGQAPWQIIIVAGPAVFGLLTPLYATIRRWHQLESVETPRLTSFVDALRSSDPLHLR